MKNIDSTSRPFSIVVVVLVLLFVVLSSRPQTKKDIQQQNMITTTPSLKTNDSRLDFVLQKCNEGDTETVLSLLDSEPALLNAIDESGWSCLINASKNNHLQLVQNLLSMGASTGTRSMKHSALRGAAIFGHDRVVAELLKAGAFVDVYSTHQRTPLMGAAMNGHVEVVKLLLQAGADANLQNDEGETASDLALSNGHLEIVKLLSTTT